MEGKSNFVILLIIVSVLTLTLAILVGYLFFVAGSPQGKNEVVYIETESIPKDEELAKKPLFEEKKLFNLKSEDNRVSVIQVNAVIRYFKRIKGIKNVEEKLTFCDEQIKETVSTYFQSLTIEQVKNPECKKKAKEDLKKELNDLLNYNEESKNKIIYDVIFDEWFYQ